MNSIMVNLWAGPGAGKSTTASALFHILKVAGVKCEICFEFAKELTYTGRREELADQYWVSAVQEHRHYLLNGKVDLIITDSPTGLGRAYVKTSAAFGGGFDKHLISQMARRVRKRYRRHLDFKLLRDPTRPFQAYGRRERTLEEALMKDNEVWTAMLDATNNPNPVEILATPSAAQQILPYIMEALNGRN